MQKSILFTDDTNREADFVLLDKAPLMLLDNVVINPRKNEKKLTTLSREIIQISMSINNIFAAIAEEYTPCLGCPYSNEKNRRYFAFDLTNTQLLVKQHAERTTNAISLLI
ncbi:MAG: hypothetical protein MJK10_11860 [Pseudomonadales bacterium]|nr:hypothetical protein [Pseudomonadales bacterium]NRA16692.1 hypothetical protein [Oceanospirillaceae bacterium]